ncbi:MAG: hypothetical protein R2854_24965 [Caldilineaceae bacterium]
MSTTGFPAAMILRRVSKPMKPGTARRSPDQPASSWSNVASARRSLDACTGAVAVNRANAAASRSIEVTVKPASQAKSCAMVFPISPAPNTAICMANPLWLWS